jgi:hypothetical protein
LDKIHGRPATYQRDRSGLFLFFIKIIIGKKGQENKG